MADSIPVYHNILGMLIPMDGAGRVNACTSMIHLLGIVRHEVFKNAILHSIHLNGHILKTGNRESLFHAVDSVPDSIYIQPSEIWRCSGRSRLKPQGLHRTKKILVKLPDPLLKWRRFFWSAG